MLNLKKTTVTTVATINQSKIVIIDNGEKHVPVKPICEALGVDFSAQLQRIKRDEILSPTMVTITTVGADQKQREMVTIPYKYALGWLFTIDVNKVRPEVKDFVINYKRQCYDALFNHFTIHAEFVEYKQKLTEEKRLEVKQARHQFNQAKNVLKEAEEQIDEILASRLDDYRHMKAQGVLEFPAHEEGGQS